MQEVLSEACKYESFNTLIKINDPEHLLEAFLSQIAPGHTESLKIEIYNLVDLRWKRVTRYGDSLDKINLDRIEILHQKINPEQINNWFYDASQDGWFCAYKPVSDKQFAIFIATDSPDALIDESYIQLLFSFYCHQLHSLESAYRDSLTGLYNRRAFDQRMTGLLNCNQYPYRRKNATTPTAFVMLDIDFFKRINDTYGHVYGDEVLSKVATLMTDSFREYDLLFRYGGEEFCAVLMDVETETCLQILERLRAKIEAFKFPGDNTVTISIGFTNFDVKQSLDVLIDQADQALYYGKQHGRNSIHHYQQLHTEGKVSR